MATQEGGNLDEIEDLPGDNRFLRVVDVGRHRQPGLRTYRLQNAQTLPEPGTAIGLVRGPVRLVIGALEDRRNIETIGKVGKMPGDRESEIETLERVGPGNHERRSLAPHANRTRAEFGRLDAIANGHEFSGIRTRGLLFMR